MSCRHDLANGTCTRCYPTRPAGAGQHGARVDPGPEGEYGPNLEGPGAVTSEEYRASLFSDRPERTSRCVTCGGSGHVTKGYALAHAEGIPGIPTPLHVARPDVDPELVIGALVVGASSIYEAVSEASEIARRSGLAVAFEFNGLGRLDDLVDMTVVVRPEDDPDMVVRAWWIKSYGKTPEESRAER